MQRLLANKSPQEVGAPPGSYPGDRWIPGPNRIRGPKPIERVRIYLAQHRHQLTFDSVDTMAAPIQDSVPRSPYDRTGGIVYFARMLNKARLHAAGRLRADFHANLGSGFDGRCCRFLGVEYPALRARVLEGGTDHEILAWCLQHGTHPGEEQVLVWNKFMLKRGWRDEDDGAIEGLESDKASSGLAHRTDLLTFFDYFEVDEGRKP